MKSAIKMKYINKRYVGPKRGIDNGVISATEKLNRGYIDFKGGGSEGL